MARTIEESIACDIPGCNKTPGNSVNGHVELTLTHTVTENGVRADAREGKPGRLDFCSFEHAAQFFADGAEDADAAEYDARLRIGS